MDVSAYTAKFLPLAISFCVGFLVSAIFRTALGIYGWRKGQSFFVSPRLTLFRPFVTVRWDNPRFNDFLAVLNILICLAAAVATFLLVVRQTAIAVSAGIGLALLLPGLGNLLLGMIDRYDIKPGRRGGGPLPPTQAPPPPANAASGGPKTPWRDNISRS